MPAKDKETNAKHQRDWYYRNLEKARKKGAEKRERLRLWLREYKSKIPCSDCGINYPYYVKDFHHKEGETKMGNVSVLVQRLGKAGLRKEIAKCDLLCANCHRIRTFSDYSETKKLDTLA